MRLIRLPSKRGVSSPAVDEPPRIEGTWARALPSRWLEVGVLATLLIVPIYPKIGLFSIQGTYIPIRVDDLAVGILSAAWLSTLIATRHAPRLPPYLWAVVTWLGTGLVASLWGALILKTVSPTLSLLFWGKYVEYAMLGVITYDVIRSRSQIARSISIVACGAAIVVVVGLLQRLALVGGYFNYASYDVRSDRVLISTIGNHHQLAAYLLMLIPVAAASSAIFNDRRLTAAAFLALVVANYVLIHTAARSAYLGLVAALGALLLVNRLSRPWATLLLATLLLLPLAEQTSAPVASPTPAPGTAAPGTTVPVALPIAPPTPATGITVLERASDPSSTLSMRIRLLEEWPRLIEAASKSPIIGLGMSAAGEAADNFYVRTLVETGGVGIAAFLMSILVVLTRLIRSSPQWVLAKQLRVAMVIVTVVLTFHATLIDTWANSRIMDLYWPLVSLTLAASVVRPAVDLVAQMKAD